MKMMHKAGMRIPIRESGFTLIEVMAAVSILALIASVTFVVVFGAVERSRFLDRRLDLQTEAVSIIRLMAEDMKSAYLADGVTPYFEGEDVFSRDIPTDRVGLLTTAVLPVSPELLTGSIGEVEYLVEEGENGQLSLVRREESPAVAPFDEGGMSYEVTKRLKSLELAYSDGEDWFDEWDSQSETSFSGKRLPRKIGIVLTLAEQGMEITHRTIVSPIMVVGR
jgi:prepilin-type N-terminal cleavage/methylation domain-containing protein